MLVDINLLPQKPKRSLKAIIITATILATALVFFISGYFIYDSKKMSLATIQNETEMVIKLREIAEQANLEEAPTDILVELQDKIEWIESQHISTVYLLNHFVSLLPQRGFFMNYQYNDQGTVSVTIQFDSPREAAAYLSRLNESTYVGKATLQQLSVSEVTDEREDQELEERFRYLPRYIGNFTIDVNREAIKIKDDKGGN
ncbi:hypothetical protein DS745_18980 [Anaerobacillus alkaliphilus]|uniref:Fimbrial assembly protein n=1 Tax=Anaerobacillus alkaliphilus TaxID=1548597 RepID=A0A4Q0VQM1_9BACI|nr:hypothetical protein [Anaerobacillus alkaliphilus]RXI98411.1 hypothetical protein DS745_18980 [Anaerobacillus alkaliphilus]